MMKKKRKDRAPLLPKVKKDIKDFLLDEEGKITKKDVARLGVSLAVLGMMMQPGEAATQPVHTDNWTYDLPQSGGKCPTFDSASSHSEHSNHSNHGNHSAGGWGC